MCSLTVYIYVNSVSHFWHFFAKKIFGVRISFNLGCDRLLINGHILGLISLNLSNMTASDLCTTHCQQSEFSCSLVFYTQTKSSSPYLYTQLKWAVYIGYCFSGPRLQCSLWSDPGLPQNLRDRNPWLFHDRITKFHNLFIDILVGWILKSCRVAASIHEN